jgi:DNA-binding NtrC family response regulator
MTLGKTVARLHREQIEEALTRHGGNRAAAAASLQMTRHVLAHRMRALGMKYPRRRPDAAST